jgi:hypothetical protein
MSPLQFPSEIATPPSPADPYGGTLAFCIVPGPVNPYLRVVYGPQSQQFTPIGDLPDGRYIGVAFLSPETLAIIRGAHARPDSPGGQYLCSTWNELLTMTEMTAHVAWLVQLEDGTWKLERDLTDGDAVVRTPAGHKMRRPPVNAGTSGYDPDYVPPVGTTRVVRVEGAVDREEVVLTGPDGVADWYDRRTGNIAPR